MRVISILRMRISTADKWRRLPEPGKHVSEIGPAMSNLLSVCLQQNILVCDVYFGRKIVKKIKIAYAIKNRTFYGVGYSDFRTGSVLIVK